MKAYGNRILIDPTPVETKTKAGIILQPKEEEKPSKGSVASVGELVKGIKKGDLIHFNKYTPIEVKDGEKKYLVIKDEDVYVVE